MLYLFSDGYVDQFNGKKGEKLMNKNFRNYLLDIYKKPLIEQKAILEKKFDVWKDDADQVDDVIIFGVRIG